MLHAPANADERDVEDLPKGALSNGPAPADSSSVLDQYGAVGTNALLVRSHPAFLIVATATAALGNHPTAGTTVTIGGLFGRPKIVRFLFDFSE